MATGDDLPLRQGAGTGSRLVRGYRGLQRQNFRSRVISNGFSIYRIFWRWFHAKMGLEVSTTHWDAPRPPGALRCLVPYSFTFWSFHEASGVSFVPKHNRQKVSAHLENFHFCTKNNTRVVLLKIASVRVSSMQIIPKPYKIIVNMA